MVIPISTGIREHRVHFTIISSYKLCRLDKLEPNGQPNHAKKYNAHKHTSAAYYRKEINQQHGPTKEAKEKKKNASTMLQAVGIVIYPNTSTIQWTIVVFMSDGAL